VAHQRNRRNGGRSVSKAAAAVARKRRRGRGEYGENIMASAAAWRKRRNENGMAISGGENNQLKSISIWQHNNGISSGGGEKSAEMLARMKYGASMAIISGVSGGVVMAMAALAHA